jgi:hypothetical protein
MKKMKKTKVTLELTFNLEFLNLSDFKKELRIDILILEECLFPNAMLKPFRLFSPFWKVLCSWSIAFYQINIVGYKSKSTPLNKFRKLVLNNKTINKK